MESRQSIVEWVFRYIFIPWLVRSLDRCRPFKLAYEDFRLAQDVTEFLYSFSAKYGVVYNKYPGRMLPPKPDTVQMASGIAVICTNGFIRHIITRWGIQTIAVQAQFTEDTRARYFRELSDALGLVKVDDVAGLAPGTVVYEVCRINERQLPEAMLRDPRKLLGPKVAFREWWRALGRYEMSKTLVSESE